MTDLYRLDIPLPHIRLHALAAGPDDGPLVVLLHGFPEFSESWSEVLPALAEAGFRAVAPDLRGYGRSDKPRGGYDIDTLASDIGELIAQLSPSGRAHVVGHDWGGAIAYHLAATQPSRVHRLAVVNCPHPVVMAKRMWRPAQLRRSWYMFFFQTPVLPETALSFAGGAAVPRLILSTMNDRSRMPPERARLYAENFAQPGVARAALAYYREMMRSFIRPSAISRFFFSYPKIQAPFRLIWGENDVALGKELTEGLEPYFEHPPEVDYLPGVGHFSTIEAPDAVAESLLEHFEAARPSARPSVEEAAQGIVFH